MAGNEDEQHIDTISEIDGSSLFSDGESDIDLPADGYFSQRQHPQQFFTRNESDGTKDQEARQPIATYHAQSQHIPGSSQYPIWAAEQAPLLDAGPAPPDYYAATADRRRNGEDLDYTHGVPSYGSIPNEEGYEQRETPRILLQAGLFGSIRAPQSMSNHLGRSNDEEAGSSVHKGRSRSWRGCAASRWTRRCMTLTTVVLVILIIVMASVLSAKHDRSNDQPTEPVISPAPSQPVANPHLRHDSTPAPTPKPGCSYSTVSDSWHYDFETVRDFSLIEHYHTHVSEYNLGGSIWIRRAPAEQVPDVRVTINYVISPGVRVINPNPALTPNSMTMSMPDVQFTSDYQQGRQPCIDAGVAIDVKQGLQLENWLTRASVFNIFTANQLFNSSDTEVLEPIGVSGTTTFSTLSGKVDVTYWNSRETIIDSTSGTVHGWFALNDLLQITTVSGAVIVAYEPQDENPQKPLPATLKISSHSGSVKADFDETVAKKRDYNTLIETKSGSITGRYVHGSLSTFKSMTGTIVTDVFPVVLSDKNQTSLSTENYSGATSIIVKSPLFDHENLTNLHSIHDSSHGSGSLLLRYPDQWSGSLTGSSQTGSLIVRGRGVKVNWYSDFGWIDGKKISASKGDGHSLLDFRTRSGSADLGIGNDLRIGGIDI